MTDGLGGDDVWVLDLARDTLTRLTFEGFDMRPVWSPDLPRPSVPKAERRS